jgi:hypothetical protein
MTVTDGRLQVQIEVGRLSVRQSILEATRKRTENVFAWTSELGIPVLPLSAAEDVAAQLRRLLGVVPARGGRGKLAHTGTEAALG